MVREYYLINQILMINEYIKCIKYHIPFKKLSKFLYPINISSVLFFRIFKSQVLFHIDNTMEGSY